MKKYIVLFSVLILGLGCGRAPQEGRILAKINNYQITQEEFEAEFKNSSYAREDTLESRKEFLDMLIGRKLILQDAQSKGLDKDKDFLKMIERFWEQSLLKRVLEIKSKEVSGNLKVSEEKLKDAYQKMSQEGKTDKTYEQARGDIIKLKEAQAVSDWMEGLRKNAKISVDEGLLK